MKIIRNGQTFELTEKELFCAYKEQQNLFDVSSVKSSMDIYLNDDEFNILYENQEFINDVAYDLRRNINKYDMDFEYALEDAFETNKEQYLL